MQGTLTQSLITYNVSLFSNHNIFMKSPLILFHTFHNSLFSQSSSFLNAFTPKCILHDYLDYILRYVWKTKIEDLVDCTLLCTISVYVPAVTMGELEVASTALLEQVRQMVNKLQESSNPCPKLSPDWCFVDCKFPLLQLTNRVLIWGDALTLHNRHVSF